MTYEEFTAYIDADFPGYKPEAIPIWKEFTEECVSMGQFANFEALKDPVEATKKWLDALYCEFVEVKQKFGTSVAASVINLSCEYCCLYPGEMMQAADCLQKGGSAKKILAMIDSGEIEAQPPFFPDSKKILASKRLACKQKKATKGISKNSKKRGVER